MPASNILSWLREASSSARSHSSLLFSTCTTSKQKTYVGTVPRLHPACVVRVPLSSGAHRVAGRLAPSLSCGGDHGHQNGSCDKRPHLGDLALGGEKCRDAAKSASPDSPGFCGNLCYGHKRLGIGTMLTVVQPPQHAHTSSGLQFGLPRICNAQRIILSVLSVLGIGCLAVLSTLQVPDTLGGHQPITVR